MYLCKIVHHNFIPHGITFDQGTLLRASQVRQEVKSEKLQAFYVTFAPNELT